MVKREFGPEAVILSARTLESGGGLSRFIKAPRVELTAATDRGGSLKQETKGSRVNISIGSEETPKVPVRSVEHRESLGREKAARTSRRLFSLFQQMLIHGVEESIAIELISRTDRIASQDEIRTEEGAVKAIHQAMKVMGVSCRRLKIEPKKKQFAAFIGPTGSGKTRTEAKFAASCMLKRGGDWLGLLTLDNDRIGSVEQLRIYARVVGIQLERAWNQESLLEAVQRLEGKELILVDTPGITKGNMPLFKESMELLHMLSPLQTFLVVSATTQLADMKAYRRMLQGIPLNGFIFTKLDEATCYGNLISELVASGIPLCYTTDSQNGPGGIEVGSVERLLARVINQETEELIGTLPPETLASAWARLDSAVEERRPQRPAELSEGADLFGEPELVQYGKRTAYGI